MADPGPASSCPAGVWPRPGYFPQPVLREGVPDGPCPRPGQYSRWMSMVTEVSFPPGMALLVARHTMLCPFSTSPGEMKRVLTMLSRLPSRRRVYGSGGEKEGPRSLITATAGRVGQDTRQPRRGGRSSVDRVRSAQDTQGRPPPCRASGHPWLPGLAERQASGGKRNCKVTCPPRHKRNQLGPSRDQAAGAM